MDLLKQWKRMIEDSFTLICKEGGYIILIKGYRTSYKRTVMCKKDLSPSSKSTFSETRRMHLISEENFVFRFWSHCTIVWVYLFIDWWALQLRVREICAFGVEILGKENKNMMEKKREKTQASDQRDKEREIYINGQNGLWETKREITAENNNSSFRTSNQKKYI